MFKRIFLIVLDSVGIGEAKDASKFGDFNVNTFGHTVEKTNVELPNFKKFGYFNLLNNTNDSTISYYTKAEEESNGKDTLTGHLEMMGVVTKVPFKTFLNTGFPDELIDSIKKISGRDVIGNKAASGTEIIEELGEEQIKTGALIVYTSADSVLQIAAHEEVIPLDELYRICEEVREITKREEWKVGRIIARPYIGTPGNFTRTAGRHDYALDPAHKTVLDNLKEKGYSVISIGKISDIFNNNGVTSINKTKDNLDGINKIIETIDTDFNGLCFANLNDYDMKYGHRRDVVGYGNSLKEFDNYIPTILNHLKDDDLLMITADHGNDPTYIGTDHTREDVPVIMYSKKFNGMKRLDNFKTFASIGATIADNFNVDSPYGESVLNELK